MSVCPKSLILSKELPLKSGFNIMTGLPYSINIFLAFKPE